MICFPGRKGIWGVALQQLSARVPCIQFSQVGSWASDSAREPHPLKSRWREPCHSFLQKPQTWCTGEWEWEWGWRASWPIELDRKSHPQALAFWACDGSGSLGDFWIPLSAILPLSWRITPHFYWDGWSLLISISNWLLSIFSSVFVLGKIDRLRVFQIFKS